MKQYRIFVSSVQKEFEKERRAIKKYILNDFLFKKHFEEVFLFEDLPSQDRHPEDLYLNEVDRDDIYLGLFGVQYSKPGERGLSPTEKEFRRATDKDKWRLVYISGKDIDRDKRMQRLVKIARDQLIGKRFKDIHDLKSKVYKSLVTYLEKMGKITRLPFDASICRRSSYKNIDENKVRWFLRSAQSERQFPLDENISFREIFIHLDLLRDQKLTNAAILLFGAEPQKFHTQAEVKCLRFHGTEIEQPFKSFHIYKGNAFEQIDKALAFVLDALNRQLIRQKGTVAVKRPREIPEFAIQEAIVNAIAHRDYYSSSGVQVMVFVDRVEIWNPGHLPPELTTEALKRPHSSYPNNPLLANALYLAGYIQKVGSGTMQMAKECRDYNLPEPEFIQQTGQFIVKIWKDIFTDSYLTKLNLNEFQLKAVKYTKEKERITNKEYRRLTGVSKPTASRHLADLVEKQVFDQIGITGKGTKYILKDSRRAQRTQRVRKAQRAKTAIGGRKAIKRLKRNKGLTKGSKGSKATKRPKGS